MEISEDKLRQGIGLGLGSQGIWTPELAEIMFKEIENQAIVADDKSNCECNDCYSKKFRNT